MCCAQTPKGGLERAMTKATTSNSMAKAPKGDMILIEYLGPNLDTEVWGGPGQTPSNSYYFFGAEDGDRVKYVRPEDVTYFLIQQAEDGSILFGEYAEPATKSIEVGGELTPIGKFGGTDPKPAKKIQRFRKGE